MAQSDSVEDISSEFNEQILINPELRICPQICNISVALDQHA
jgi:hypothetical protein